jgi:hypothetical protein
MANLPKRLHQELGINKARAKFITLFIASLIRVRTVNLTEIALNFSPEVESPSSYRRIQDFFVRFKMCYHLLAKLIMSLLPKDPLVLSIDRTNWQFGKADINIFMLSVEYHGVAVPVLWHMLNKRGNSNQTERITLLKEFTGLFGKHRIDKLLADREFIGEQWIKYLKKEGITFGVRVKHNMIADNIKGIVGQKKLSELFASPKTRVYKSISIFGTTLNIAGKKLTHKDDYLIIVTNGAAQNILEQYRRRWKIETMFSFLKTRGFNLESTHMTCPNKLRMLVGLLAIAFLFCLSIGVQKNKEKPIGIKTHGRKAISLFRYGLDNIRKIVCGNKAFCYQLYWQIKKVIDAMTTMTLIRIAN